MADPTPTDSRPIPLPVTDTRAGWLALMPALAVAGLTSMALVLSSYWPPERGEMAVVLAPGASEQQVYAAILAAGGRYVAPNRFSNIAIAFAPDAGFQQRVRGQGALFALRATGLCAPVAPGSEETTSVT